MSKLLALLSITTSVRLVESSQCLPQTLTHTNTLHNVWGSGELFSAALDSFSLVAWTQISRQLSRRGERKFWGGRRRVPGGVGRRGEWSAWNRKHFNSQQNLFFMIARTNSAPLNTFSLLRNELRGIFTTGLE